MPHQLVQAAIGITSGIFLALACSVGLAGTPHDAPLFERLGGSATVKAVVDEVIDEAAGNIHTRRSFENTDVERIKRLLAEQICALTGGGCTYSGDSMRDVHAGLGITQAELYDLVQFLRDALIRHHVALRERNELLRILAPMKRDIVEK